MNLELIMDRPYPSRAERFMRALRDSRPQGVVLRLAYNPTSADIMCYGPGALVRQDYIKKHVASGHHVVMWDLAYFDRARAMRLAIDTQHPTPEQLAMTTGKPRRKFVLREDANPKGPILLVGMGEKSNRQHGLGRLQWERNAVREIQKLFPGRPIWHRPKHRPIPVEGTKSLPPRTPIADILRGCSAVWCRHSNVAVDACIAGIPVYCTHGAAFALYKDNPNPTPEQRLDFLNRLSWWEWGNNDLYDAWKWIQWLLENSGSTSGAASDALPDTSA